LTNVDIKRRYEVKAQEVDPLLEKRMVKYEELSNKWHISFASKVIPVSESLKAKQCVLLTERAISILKNAKSVALQNVYRGLTTTGSASR
jgi:hypothetical protein